MGPHLCSLQKAVTHQCLSHIAGATCYVGQINLSLKKDVGEIGSEVRLQKQKDVAKGDKKAKEVPAHQASCRGLRSAPGLGRCGLTDSCNRDLPRASKG